MSAWELITRERDELREKLFKEGEDDLGKILQSCGNNMSLTCMACGSKHEVETQCKRRWCPACAPRISAQRLSRMKYGVEKLQWPLFVTLTVPNAKSAQQCFRKLRASFGKFRRTKFWIHTVTGGMASMEVTNTGEGWHPHLHCLIDCRWLSLDTPQPQRRDPKHVVDEKCKAAQQELSERWAKCIKEPIGIVWVKRTKADAIIEVLKYAVKPGDLVECKEPVGDLIRAMERCRLITTFGGLYGLGAEWKKQEKLEKKTKPCPSCQNVGQWIPSEIADRICSRDELITPGAFRQSVYSHGGT